MSDEQAFHDALGLTDDERIWFNAVNDPDPADIPESSGGFSLLMMRIMCALPPDWTVGRVALIAVSFQRKLDDWRRRMGET